MAQVHRIFTGGCLAVAALACGSSDEEPARGRSKGGTAAGGATERHTTASHFRLDPTLTLVNCGTIAPDIN
jgi:hypothetical protein